MKLQFLILALLIGSSFIGCRNQSGEKEARSTALAFWLALNQGDKQAVAKYVRKNEDLSFFPTSDARDIIVEVRGMKKNKDHIELETNLIPNGGKTKESDTDKPMSVNTFMVKEEGKWKVDYENTMGSFMEAAFASNEQSGLPIEVEVNASVTNGNPSDGQSIVIEFGEESEWEVVKAEDTAKRAQQINVSGTLEYRGKKLILRSGILDSWSPQEKELDLTLFPYDLNLDDLKDYPSNPVFVTFNKKSPDVEQWADWSPYIGLDISFAYDSTTYTKKEIDLLAIHIHWWDQRNESKSFNFRESQVPKHFTFFRITDGDPASVDFNLNLIDPRWPDEGIKCMLKVSGLKTWGPSEIGKNKGSIDQNQKKLLREKYKLNLDKIKKGTYTVEQVQHTIDERVLEEANKDFSSDFREELVRQARDKFPLYKKGDRVSVQTRLHSYQGILERIYPSKIKVGSKYFLLQDLIHPDPVCFKEEKCQKRRDHFVRIKYDIPREDFIKERTKDLTKSIYRDHGFVRVKKDWVHYTKLIEN